MNPAPGSGVRVYGGSGGPPRLYVVESRTAGQSKVARHSGVSQREVSQILHAAGTSRKIRDYRRWKPLTTVSWNKPSWPRRGGQTALQRAGFGLTDTVGRRFAYCRANDDIARAEHPVRMCARLEIALVREERIDSNLAGAIQRQRR